MWIITIKGTKKALPATSGYNKRKVNFTGTQGSCSQSSSFRKFRTRAGGPKMATTSETMVWRPKLPTTSRTRIWQNLDWDASSAEEALEKAKARYWCKLNGFPFESMINEEDWNPEIDPEMSLALDRRYENDAIINEGGNDWLTKDYLQNKDKKVIKGWSSDYTGGNEYKNN
ncbi:hypothetical protein MKW98_016155 [Papaver atlanticum]|uniref:Uncharacterized protein n=1 Tax=Papaver atlanticum TaxID=357466 RepID=A0AAD4S207_9MAGN|nr:hypothetical protein MKW98_016155 [Papaver atlanticum]